MPLLTVRTSCAAPSQVVQQNLVDTDKLMSLLEEEADIKDEPNAKDLVVTEGIVEFRNVHFAYDNGRVPALKGLSFKLSAKSACALVGESGSGKSTILRLLLRFYAPQQGQILIDGQDIAKVTQKSLRKSIGIVPQESSLFNASIRTNILYGRVEADDDEIVEAAKAAQIWDKVQSFPDKMATVVGERGQKLSGGEKQRVSIARAFLKKAPLLLCDEATSALDSGTERLLQTALKDLLKGRTSLTIAHRLSTIINSDTIYVIKDGNVVEQGSHEELVQREGEYAALWLKQIQTQREAEAAAAAAAQVKAELALGSPISPKSPTAEIAAMTKEQLARAVEGANAPQSGDASTLADGQAPASVAPEQKEVAKASEGSPEVPTKSGKDASTSQEAYIIDKQETEIPSRQAEPAAPPASENLSPAAAVAPPTAGVSFPSSGNDDDTPRPSQLAPDSAARRQERPSLRVVDASSQAGAADVDLESGSVSIADTSTNSAGGGSAPSRTSSFRQRVSSLMSRGRADSSASGSGAGASAGGDSQGQASAGKGSSSKGSKAGKKRSKK